MAWMVVQLRSASSSRLCSCVDSDIVNRWPSAAAVVTLVRNKKSSSSNELEMAIDRTIDRWTIKFPSSSLHRIDVFKIEWWMVVVCQSKLSINNNTRLGSGLDGRGWDNNNNERSRHSIRQVPKAQQIAAVVYEETCTGGEWGGVGELDGGTEEERSWTKRLHLALCNIHRWHSFWARQDHFNGYAMINCSHSLWRRRRRERRDCNIGEL